MIRVNVRLFAAAREIVGRGETVMFLPAGSTPLTVLQSLFEEYPLLREWNRHLRVAVNCDYVALSSILNENDELAIIPPVSGG